MPPTSHTTFVLWFVCVVKLGWGMGDDVLSLLLSSSGQEELASMRRQLEGKDGEMRRLQDDSSFKPVATSSPEGLERGGECNHSQASLTFQHRSLISDIRHIKGSISPQFLIVFVLC